MEVCQWLLGAAHACGEQFLLLTILQPVYLPWLTTKLAGPTWSGGTRSISLHCRSLVHALIKCCTTAAVLDGSRGKSRMLCANLVSQSTLTPQSARLLWNRHVAGTCKVKQANKHKRCFEVRASLAFPTDTSYLFGLISWLGNNSPCLLTVSYQTVAVCLICAIRVGLTVVPLRLKVLFLSSEV